MMPLLNSKRTKIELIYFRYYNTKDFLALHALFCLSQFVGFLLFILFQFHADKQVLNMFNYKPWISNALQ